MSEVLLFFGLAVALASILANIGIWSPRKLWVKVAAVAVVALFLPLSYASLSELLSRPKPVNVEWAQRAVPEAIVLGARMVEDEAIYLWLGFEGQQEPRSYSLPWDQESAKQLHEAQRKAEAEGTQVKVHKPFELTLDELERKFYAEPHQAPPPKQAADSGAMQFQGSSDAATAKAD